MRRFFLLSCILLAVALRAGAQPEPKDVLILTSGRADIRTPSLGEARQLGALLGHFSTSVTIKSALDYKAGEAEDYDVVFYVGTDLKHVPPAGFVDELIARAAPTVWINTGMAEASVRRDFQKKFGFSVSGIDSVSRFDRVRAGSAIFTKGGAETQPHSCDEPAHGARAGNGRFHDDAA